MFTYGQRTLHILLCKQKLVQNKLYFVLSKENLISQFVEIGIVVFKINFTYNFS